MRIVHYGECASAYHSTSASGRGRGWPGGRLYQEGPREAHAQSSEKSAELSLLARVPSPTSRNRATTFIKIVLNI